VGDRAHLWNTRAQLQHLQHVATHLPDLAAPVAKQEREPTHARARRLKDQQVKELTAAYEAGATLRQLAGQFGIERRTVGKVLKRNGVEVRWRRLTEADVDEAERRYAQGLSLVKVADRLGVNDDTVRLRLLKRGVQMRDPHWRG
jgi:DNA-binding transcriptional regulator LsrR (DeoR family)